mmetsp:Transcript_28171/g.47859  ORF Transcript_28171/g.47859 Transcript_28171/m.47859 type:complete len:255 (-) Transcript_28171:293-1057(-)
MPITPQQRLRSMNTPILVEPLRVRVVHQQKERPGVQYGQIQEERQSRQGVLPEVRSEVDGEGVEGVEEGGDRLAPRSRGEFARVQSQGGADGFDSGLLFPESSSSPSCGGGGGGSHATAADGTAFLRNDTDPATGETHLLVRGRHAGKRHVHRDQPLIGALQALLGGLRTQHRALQPILHRGYLPPPRVDLGLHIEYLFREGCDLLSQVVRLLMVLSGRLTSESLTGSGGGIMVVVITLHQHSRTGLRSSSRAP